MGGLGRGVVEVMTGGGREGEREVVDEGVAEREKRRVRPTGDFFLKSRIISKLKDVHP